MPDASVTALGRADSISNNGNFTPTIKLTTTTSNRTGRTAPRVEIEPLYTELKKLVGDHWSTYKDAFGQFMLGKTGLMQDEATVLM
jgi:hypothetical protein